MQDNGILPRISEIQLTKRAGFFKTDLEVHIVMFHPMDEGETLTLEVLDFNGDLFDEIYKEYFLRKEREYLYEMSVKENKHQEVFALALKDIIK